MGLKKKWKKQKISKRPIGQWASELEADAVEEHLLLQEFNIIPKTEV